MKTEVKYSTWPSLLQFGYLSQGMQCFTNLGEFEFPPVS